jgi:type IV fimbrial biogenesis protein FimT
MALVSQSVLNGAETGRRGIPFIGLLVPFVGRIDRPVRPFICKKRPFILNRASFGFTLIELIATLVIAGILMALAAPSFSNFVKNNRLTTQANDIMADLAFARSEAVKSGTNITVCKSTDGTTCNPGAAWNDGWIVVNTASGQVFRAHEALTGRNTMVGTASAAPGLTDQIVYTRTGVSGLQALEEFRICDYDRGPAQGRLIEIAITGRARIAIDANTSRPLPPAACSP